MTLKVAVAALLVASLTAGCGASAEEKETACWAKRQAIIAEISAVAIMDPWVQYSVYNERAEEFWGEDYDEVELSHTTDQGWNARTISHMLEADLPDC